MLIGCAQALAFIPGTSRLGICTTMSRFLGVDRWQGVTFAFILSIPVLLGAVVLSGYDLAHAGKLDTVTHLWPAVLITFVLSLGFLPLLKMFLQRFTFIPFAIYRILFGAFLVYEAFHLGVEVKFWIFH
jgi:undecaprenyl-diphosphatase